MGLIKAGMGALGGTLADQWKEFFYCDSLDKDVLMVKGQKRTSRRSSNNGEDNIITNGSGIAVADGQCMLIVEQGRVVEVCAEPGEFTFDAFSKFWSWLLAPVWRYGASSTFWKVTGRITLRQMLMYGREAQSKTKTASPATIPKSGERNRKIHSCVLYLISI